MASLLCKPAPAPCGPALDLLGLVRQLAMARSQAEVTACVRTAARRLTGADGITFVLRDGDRCHYADEDAIGPLWKGQRFPLTACISGWAMLNGLSAVIEDIDADPRIPHAAYRRTFVKSLVMVPVRRDDPVAAIGAYWATRHRALPDEVALLESIADAASVTLTNLALVDSLQRQTAELARAKAELERANEQKSRFLAACSHDLRQPFQAMRLFHGILEQSAGPAQQVAVDRLGDALSQGETLLHALVDVSTIESGRVRVQPRPVAVDEVLDGLKASYGERAAVDGLDFRVEPCGHTVTTDPALVARLLGNLLDNALKFTELGRIVLRARRRGDRLVLQVWDSGIGIARHGREDIFEDFYQAANSERDSRRGIGLGLGIVRRLAPMVDGRMRVLSRPGRGSVFSLSIPA